MSRLGKKPLLIPNGTTVTCSDNVVTVKGPKGELSKTFRPVVDIAVSDNEVKVDPKKYDKEGRALWGTYASHIKNMMEGVNEPFTKKLVVEGVGYRAQVQGNKLVLDLGFSHQIEMEIPQELEVTVEKDTITISGADKEMVGQFAANVRKHRKPEPYKGKGVRYDDEIVRRKQGKKAV